LKSDVSAPRNSQIPNPDSQILLRARAVVPVTRPPIADGAVLISGKRIAAVDRWRELSKSAGKGVFVLGDVIVLPGLVNAHCHLDYTNMAGELLPPKSFTDWLKLILETKAGWSNADFAESWKQGVEMLLRTGTTTVGDVEAIPELLPGVWESTPLRVFSFLEVTGIKSRRAPRAILQESVRRIRKLRSQRCRTGLSPHAPYSTLPELLKLSAQAARLRKWRLTTHVAESAVEFEMFANGRGEMFDWLQRSSRDMSDCSLGSPVEHLARCGALSENLLAIHVNYLGAKDAGLLAKAKAHVVHCPRSHTYFGHDPFPLRKLNRAGVNVCLGTDSLASVCKRRRQAVELNLFEEMRELAMKNPAMPPKAIVQMATINSARALGMGGRIGELSEGACADLICIPFAGKIQDAYDAVLHHRGDVAGSMIAGEWSIAPTLEKV
jgi:cytosine/adenosine deaminase-related metal-dependent hydrolase